MIRVDLATMEPRKSGIYLLSRASRWPVFTLTVSWRQAEGEGSLPRSANGVGESYQCSDTRLEGQGTWEALLTRMKEGSRVQALSCAVVYSYTVHESVKAQALFTAYASARILADAHGRVTNAGPKCNDSSTPQICSQP